PERAARTPVQIGQTSDRWSQPRTHYGLARSEFQRARTRVEVDAARTMPAVIPAKRRGKAELLVRPFRAEIGENPSPAHGGVSRPRRRVPRPPDSSGNDRDRGTSESDRVVPDTWWRSSRRRRRFGVSRARRRSQHGSP